MAFLLLNGVGIIVVLGALVQWRYGVVPLHRVLAVALAVSFLAPFVWVAMLRGLPVHTAPPGSATRRLI